MSTARAGLQLDLQLPASLDGLDPETELSLYRIAQEALTNVTRHAQARALAVRLERQGQRLVLAIADDGRGFDAAGIEPGEHYGLPGMRERATAVGGDLEVRSWPGRGTTVCFSVEVTDGARTNL